MKKYLQPGLDYLIYSNLFIACAAMAQGALTYLLLHSSINYEIIVLLFFCCLFTYNLASIKNIDSGNEQTLNSRERWISKHYPVVYTLLLISALAIVLFTLLVSLESIVVLFILGTLSVLYNIPIPIPGKRKIILRKISGLKLFLIAFVWSGSCVLIPYFESDAVLSLKNISILFIKRFLFITAITIPFDIRDIYNDYKNDVKTLPLLIGKKASYLFCLILIFICILLFIAYDYSQDSGVFYGLILTLLISAVLIFNSRIHKNEYYYLIILDGMLILQYFLVLLFKSLL